MARTYEEQMDARVDRRLRADARAYERLEHRETAAEQMVGELCREGRTVFYVWPLGGKYREGSRAELVEFLIRNRYA